MSRFNFVLDFLSHRQGLLISITENLYKGVLPGGKYDRCFYLFCSSW